MFILFSVWYSMYICIYTMPDAEMVNIYLKKAIWQFQWTKTIGSLKINNIYSIVCVYKNKKKHIKIF